ncbi:sensor histidine kinase [Ramlibacter sp. PS4R-6]|uniref:sensor histidine kinase n=1 Tax=Ramlibacter sp. PS4R-6 TaxID=3133438 RepID=UPI0030A4D2D1
MEPEKKPVPQRRFGLDVDWLLRANAQVSTWAASMSWWRLLLLFIIVIAAGGIISEQLHLRHDTVKVVRNKEKNNVDVQIGGPGGITIVRRRATPTPAASAASAPSAEHEDEEAAEKPPAPPIPPVPGKKGIRIEGIDVDTDDDDDTPRTISKQIFTFRGLIGDVGSALLVIVFAYLVASKIVVRKVAQADAKVKSAQQSAEHEAMERQLVQARLQVLQAQVEPHFLFNTLGAIDYLIETDPKRASQMQKALIVYLRGALPQMRQETSTLGRELRLIRSFLDLLKMRMEDRLDVEFAVPEGAESAEFPPMMLQSLVENAIKHGIEPKPEGGKVTVAARIQNGQLWVEVRDTGIGIPDTTRLESATSGTGLGLQNIRERLAMMFPGKSRLMIVSDDTQGTTVKIVVPYQVGPETVANIDGLRGTPA